MRALVMTTNLGRGAWREATGEHIRERKEIVAGTLKLDPSEKESYAKGETDYGYANTTDYHN